MYFDKDDCQTDKEICRAEVLYDTEKSAERAQGRAECQSAGDGAVMRRVAADDQFDRAGRLFAVCHPCPDDCESMRRGGGRGFLFAGGNGK